MEGKQEILMIREEKHNEYLHKADGKSLSLKNKKNNKNSNQYNDLQDRNANKNDPKKPPTINLIRHEVSVQLSVVLWWTVLTKK